MKVLLVNVIALFAPLTLHLVEANVDGKAKVSKAYNNPFPGAPKPRFISFNSDEGKIDIDWDITIPFLSIPINHEPGENGEVAPLLNINTKALGLAGIITAIITFVVPLFSKPNPELNYRSNNVNEWSEIGHNINELIFGNNYVTPCMQRVVCSMISMASEAKNPTSAEKIIDGLSSHKWFKNITNGTIIQDAVTIGRDGNRDCARVYKDCLVTPRILKVLMDQFGQI